jgi:hypothetical protein
VGQIPIDGELIFSKKKLGCHAEIEVRQLLKDKLK